MSDYVQSVPSQEVLYTLAIYILAKSLHEILEEGSGRPLEILSCTRRVGV